MSKNKKATMKKYCYEIIIVFLFLTSCKGNTDSTLTARPSTSKNEIHKNIHIMAKPDSIAIDASRTAIIVVDMENDFGAKGGMFDRAGVNISMIQKVID